jgi:hypothetical protein
MDQLNIDLARMQERIGVVQATVDKAHTRIDGLQSEVKAELREISTDVKILIAHMNRNQGSRSSIVFMITLSVALLGALAKLLIK